MASPSASTNGGIIGVTNNASFGKGVITYKTADGSVTTQPGTRAATMLLIAGGGAGSSERGGGGGAGGLREMSIPVCGDTPYAAVIGGGVTGGPVSPPGARGTDGTNSTFTVGCTVYTSEGGGGGASAVGITPTNNSAPSGDGGAGLASSITGSSVTYAGGGGGGGNTQQSGDRQGAGGAGGGGNGGIANSTTGRPGINGLGGGGGGGYGNGSCAGGAGGSGIVVLKYTPAASTTLWVSNGSGTLSSVRAGVGGVDKLLATTTVSSAVANISFTSGIDSSYKEYVFRFINMHPATNSTSWTFQVNASGQSGFNETITSNAFAAQHAENDTDAALTFQGGYAQGTGTSYQVINYNTGNQNDASVSGELHLFNPAGGQVKQFYGVSNEMLEAAYTINFFIGGYFDITAAITEIDFKFASGNIDAGTIKMYGIVS